MAGKTYYEILGVASSASAQDIRKAFHKLSLKMHPDKAGNTTEANDAFIALKDAYDTLSDAEKRQDYDFELEQKQKPRPRAQKAQYRPESTEYRPSQPPNRDYDGYQSNEYRGESSSSRSYAPWGESSEFRSRHPSCPRVENPRHGEVFASGGRHYCLCHQCERRILGDVYTRKDQVAEVIGDINFVNRHVTELWKTAPALFTPHMRHDLIILEQTIHAQLVFLDAWTERTIAWVGCPTCTRRVLSQQVLADVEKMCRQIEYWSRHVPTLASLTREAIFGYPLDDPWDWAEDFRTALDKCRRDDV